MPNLTPRMIRDAIHEGLAESVLLAALGYDPSLGHPRARLLNDALELLGHGRPVDDRALDPSTLANSGEWLRAIASAVIGRRDAAPGEVNAALKPGAPRCEGHIA
jgi:hypothetical protein